MPVTQSLSSKGNVKKFTNQDVPFSPQQPVISSYYAVSTAGQTVINMSFSVDQTLTDQFFLFVDGKKLRLGASNDFTFTAVGSDNRSSQVTLNYSLPVNYNIQAFQLGLKAETAFGIDNRFVSLYESQTNGFQGFVNQQTLNSATTTTGAPASGFFYSAVINRAQMVDLSQDLKARSAIDRIMTQQLYQLQNENGSNGELVYSVVNDLFGQIRAVGVWTNSATNDQGSYIRTDSPDSFVEVTFYGTGLNMMVRATSGSNTNDWRVSTDGGAEGSNIWPSSTLSSALQARFYAANQVIPVISGLALGVHTVKLRANSSTPHFIFGFEFLNDSSIRINPGVGYISGQKYTLAAQSAVAYNAIATGTKGGRVVSYLLGTGAIASAWQATNVTAVYGASVDHTNEEVARTYYIREFGSGRTDDFSRTINSPASNKAFTLDDGTTSLVGSNIGVGAIGGQESLLLSFLNGDFMCFTFVGTGLDLNYSPDGSGTNGSATAFQVFVDGTAQLNFPTLSPGVGQRQFKIASGLPYGTHTVKILRNVVSAWNVGISCFTVYQPKKPAIPAGAIEIADYNVLANYDGTTATGTTAADWTQNPVGTLNKASIREFVYTVNFAANGIVTTFPDGWSVGTSTNGDFLQYSFYGTGVNFLFNTSGAGTADFTATIDASLNATGTPRGGTSNLGGGSYRIPSTASSPARLEFTGLTLGHHTVKLAKTAGSGAVEMNRAWIITPIHSLKSNIYADILNTLPVGSCGLSDNRKLTPVREALPGQKAWSQAIGISSAPSTTSTALVPVPDLSVAINVKSNFIKISYTATFSHSAGGSDNIFAMYVDGIAVGNQVTTAVGTASANASVSDSFIVPVSPGTHKIDIYYAVSAGTMTLATTKRNLTVEEK